MRAANYIIAFSLGVLAISALHQVATPPGWLVGDATAICEPASPCNMPAETYQAVQLSIDWLEADGVTPCPEPAADQHPQNTCGPDPQIRQWIAFTRGDVAWGPGAIDHDVLVSQGPIYSGGPEPMGIAEYSGIGHSGRIAWGGVVSFRLPAAVFQNPRFPATIAPSEADTQAWFELACAASPTCGDGGLTPAEFETLLAGSQGMATHDHPFSFTLTGANTVNGVQVADAVQVNGVTSEPR